MGSACGKQALASVHPDHAPDPPSPETPPPQEDALAPCSLGETEVSTGTPQKPRSTSSLEARDLVLCPPNGNGSEQSNAQSPQASPGTDDTGGDEKADWPFEGEFGELVVEIGDTHVVEVVKTATLEELSTVEARLASAATALEASLSLANQKVGGGAAGYLAVSDRLEQDLRESLARADELATRLEEAEAMVSRLRDEVSVPPKSCDCLAPVISGFPTEKRDRTEENRRAVSPYE
ncbi:hypothetical protein BDK51DRAFT_38260 [Blyttiomyces helicus]|uniref:Uncharacterized protein n=1 Tax=Blyttiomyces helicus TaxID=388810 RepID=A0A4P9W7Y2_9FUNG|nr:hypothetical protein BDK51DRAFT_38260 [Blyttiomyces helicus]|eukprot:RKO86880.1 hypothetical protein BDK51DRAFT_38260 [Blyttiomyces helicus]